MTTDSPTTDSPTTDSPTTDSPTTDSPTTNEGQPMFIYKEEQFNGSNGRIVIRRHIVAGSKPETWREFFGVAAVDLPLGVDEAGEMLVKNHEIIFPFFGVTTTPTRNPMQCVQACFKVYDVVEQAARLSTFESYKAHVRAQLAQSAGDAPDATPHKSIITTVRATAGERHLDRAGNEIPAPVAQPKRSIIIGG